VISAIRVPSSRGGDVTYRVLADFVVVVHFAFVVFVAVGGLLAWRWPWLIWVHVPLVLWAAGIVTIGYSCPLTGLERALRRRGDESAGGDGFVDRYLEDVLFPGELTPYLRVLMAAAIAVGWSGFMIRRRRAVESRREQVAA
jgi:hypothetical protein